MADRRVSSATLTEECVEWRHTERGGELRDTTEEDAWIRIQFHADRARGPPSVPVCPECLTLLPATGKNARCPECKERLGRM